jgi:hypothetical protein
MSGAILPLPQYAFMAWCSFKKAQGQLHVYFYDTWSWTSIFFYRSQFHYYITGSRIDENVWTSEGGIRGRLEKTA